MSLALIWTKNRRQKSLIQRTPPSGLEMFIGHVTRPDQGLSLSLALGGGKKRDPGNEVDHFCDASQAGYGE